MEQEPKKPKSSIARKLKWWSLLTIGTVISFTLALISVVKDHNSLFFLFIFLGALFVIAQVIVFFIALFSRQWGHSIGLFISIIFSVYIAFSCLILTMVGQHHPPKYPPIDKDSLTIDTIPEDSPALDTSPNV